MSRSRSRLNILPFIFKSIFPTAWRTTCKALTHTQVLCLFFLSLTTFQSLLLVFHPPARILLLHKSLFSLLHKLHYSPAITLFFKNFMGPTKACVQDLMFMSRGDRNLGVAFQTHPGVRPRLEGKQRTLLSLQVLTGISWSQLRGLKRVKPPVESGERTRFCSPCQAGNKSLIS